MASAEDILKKYGSKIEKQIGSRQETQDVSKEYGQFKEDMMPQLTRFEKLTYSFGKLGFKVSEKDRVKMQKQLDIAHLDINPGQVASFALFGMFVVFMVSLLVFFGVFFFTEGVFFDYLFGPAGLFLFLGLIASMFVFYYIYSSPARLANKWRLRASSQMVPCILYIVIYMKHTANLERAIEFASQHLQQPLSLDLKKIFWDVETGKFSTIKESLDGYLKTWENYSLEFVEAFHLVESSLYEPSEARRVQVLEKALQVILDGVYEKMLVFSRNIRSPLTNLYMLGIVLPTLGLALLPLASTLLQGAIKFYHVFILFNIIIPFFVFYLSSQIVLSRPGGYGESEILELNPDYPKYKSKKPYYIAFAICFPLFLIGILPLLFQFSFFVNGLGLQPDYTFENIGVGVLEKVNFFDFKDADARVPIRTNEQLANAGKIVGPFGLLALILGMFAPLSVGLFFSIAFNMKTKELIKSRDNTKQLEKEFTNSLFQLGNRLGDGMPAELAFARVAESTKGQRTEEFFRRVNLNINQAGMSLDRAIFDENRGAIIYFPSQLVSTSMRILLESIKKGLKIAAQSLMSISEYIKNIYKVEQRLADLLAEVISDMRSNMTFLAPLLSGIVIGLAAMITMILNILSGVFAGIEGGAETGLFAGIDVSTFFDIYTMIPPYYLQIAIGFYIIQVIFILSNVLVIVDSGDDKLKFTRDVGKNLRTGLILYCIVAFLSIVVLSVLAVIAVGGVGG